MNVLKNILPREFNIEKHTVHRTKKQCSENSSEHHLISTISLRNLRNIISTNNCPTCDQLTDAELTFHAISPFLIIDRSQDIFSEYPDEITLSVNGTEYKFKLSYGGIKSDLPNSKPYYSSIFMLNENFWFYFDPLGTPPLRKVINIPASSVDGTSCVFIR